MLIKRLAIKRGIRFVRIDQRKCGSVCAQCKDELPEESCNICKEVFYITRTNSHAVSYAYYIPET